MATAAVLECYAPSDRTRMFAGLVQGSKRKAVQHAEGGFVTSTRHCHASRSPVLVHVTFFKHVAPIRTRDREACRYVVPAKMSTRENAHLSILSIATKMVFPGERKPFPFHFAVRVSRAYSPLTWTYTCR